MDGIIAIAIILGVLGFLSLLAVDYKTNFPKTYTVYKKFILIVKCIIAVLVTLSLLFSPLVIGIMFGWQSGIAAVVLGWGLGIVSIIVMSSLLKLLFNDFEFD